MVKVQALQTEDFRFISSFKISSTLSNLSLSIQEGMTNQPWWRSGENSVCDQKVRGSNTTA